MEGQSGVRRTTGFMKAMLWLGVALVGTAAGQLYFFPTRTGDFFAWTIAVPLTAAFLGGFYGTSFFLAAMSARRGTWVEARVALPGVQVFVWLTLFATLLHIDLFHLDVDDQIARGAAWLWLVVYIVDPPLLTIAYVLQLRRRGSDPPRTRPTPIAFRALLGVQAVVTLVLAVVLFAAPDVGASWWPWALTPLTARAIAAWLAGLGLVLVSAIIDNDWERLKPAVVTYLVLGILQVGALIRYRDDFEGGLAGRVYLSMVALILLTGIWGTAAAYRTRPDALPREAPRDMPGDGHPGDPVGGRGL